MCGVAPTKRGIWPMLATAFRVILTQEIGMNQTQVFGRVDEVA